MKGIIRVFITDNDLYKFIDEYAGDDKPVIAYTYESFKKSIARDTKEINTTCLEAVNSMFYRQGYEIEVYSDNHKMKFSDALAGKHSSKEIRMEHDWCKLVLNGEFDIPTNWIWCFYPGQEVRITMFGKDALYDENDTYFGIHEVYYNEKNEPTAWTKDTISLLFEDQEDWDIIQSHTKSAFEQTVLMETTANDKSSKLEDVGKLFSELEEENVKK